MTRYNEEPTTPEPTEGEPVPTEGGEPTAE